MAIGMVKATKAAIAPTLKIALMAISPAKMRRSKRIPMTQLNHTAMTGVLVTGCTCFQILENGKQSSRAYAYVTREAATMHP